MTPAVDASAVVITDEPGTSDSTAVAQFAALLAVALGLVGQAGLGRHGRPGPRR